MGCLRLILAFSVFHVHSGGAAMLRLLPADTSVHCFYVISGFYMAMVLNGKYSSGNASYSIFIGNRLLRLLPAYFCVALATVAFSAACTRFGLHPLGAVENLTVALTETGSVGTRIFLAFSQLSLLFQDWYLFAGWDPVHGIHFTPDFRNDPHPLYEYLLVPQAWSLSLELYFYLMAPFAVRSSIRRIVGLIVASLFIRIVAMTAFGLREDPWSYRFFPSELAFFLAGALVYRLHREATAGRFLTRDKWVLLLGLILGTVDLAGFWHEGSGFASLLRIPFIACLVWGLPGLFALTKNWKIDRYVGQLSYPLYISHVLVIWVYSIFFGAVSGLAAWTMLGLCALAVAILLFELVERPCDNFRSKYLRVREQPSGITAAIN